MSDSDKYTFDYIDYNKKIWMAATPEPSTVFRCTQHLPENIKKLLVEKLQQLKETYTDLDELIYQQPVEPVCICDKHVHPASDYFLRNKYQCCDGTLLQWVDISWHFNDDMNYSNDDEEDNEPHNKKCGICAFQQGITKVRETVYKTKLFRIMEKNWITPRPDGTCSYAEWSWNKMKQELESEGVQFN